MMTLETTTQFRKDYKRAKKRGYNMALLGEVLDTLLSGAPLAPKLTLPAHLIGMSSLIQVVGNIGEVA